MTKVDPEVRIPDPIELDRLEEDRLRAAAGLQPVHREPAEYAGFDQVGIPDRPPQTEREQEVYTLGEGEMLINLGPQHPSTHGVMRLVVKVRGEVIVEIDPVLGYLHRGIEKLCENATYTTVLTYVDPMDYLATMHNEHAPAIAFEKLYGIKAPPRAEYIRALVVELNRIFSHSLMMGFLALDMGGLTPILYSFINRDEIVEMLSAISGQRMLFNFFRVGGVNWDVNDEFLSRLGTWRGHVLKNIEMNEWMITENEIFTARTRGMGVLTGDEAISLGVTGPNLRASGVPFDVRKAHPYSIYDELEFDVITQTAGRLVLAVSPAHRRDQAEHPPDRPDHRQDAARAGAGPGAGHHPAEAGTCLRGGRVAARPVQRLRHQRRRAEPVSVPDARSELHQPSGDAEAHARDGSSPT